MWEVYGTDSFLARPIRRMSLVGSVVKGMEMVICFGSAPFSPVACLGASYLSLSLLWPLIVVIASLSVVASLVAWTQRCW